MLGSISTIVTFGFGSFGSVNLVPVLGFPIAVDDPQPGGPGGAGASQMTLLGV